MVGLAARRLVNVVYSCGRVTGFFSIYTLPRGSTARLIMYGLKSGLACVAVGRFTWMVCCLCMVRLTIMNEASRKNIMSISGMISSRAFLWRKGETIFIVAEEGLRWSVQSRA